MARRRRDTTDDVVATEAALVRRLHLLTRACAVPAVDNPDARFRQAADEAARLERDGLSRAEQLDTLERFLEAIGLWRYAVRHTDGGLGGVLDAPPSLTASESAFPPRGLETC
jgi:hypothetical protein